MITRTWRKSSDDTWFKLLVGCLLHNAFVRHADCITGDQAHGANRIRPDVTSLLTRSSAIKQHQQVYLTPWCTQPPIRLQPRAMKLMPKAVHPNPSRACCLKRGGLGLEPLASLWMTQAASYQLQQCCVSQRDPPATVWSRCRLGRATAAWSTAHHHHMVSRPRGLQSRMPMRQALRTPLPQRVHLQQSQKQTRSVRRLKLEQLEWECGPCQQARSGSRYRDQHERSCPVKG